MDFGLFKGVERINLKQHFCINTDFFFFPSKHQVLFFLLHEVLIKNASLGESQFHC